MGVEDDFNTDQLTVDESFQDQPGSSIFTEGQRGQYDEYVRPPEVEDDDQYRRVQTPTSTGEAWDTRAWGTDQETWSRPSVDPIQSGDDVWGYKDQPGMALPEMPRTPRYSSDSARFILNGMSAMELEALQREFIRAGYINEEDIYAGRATLLPTFTALVQTADMNRVSWEIQMQGDTERKAAWDAEHPNEKPSYGPFMAPDYLKPDYVTLAMSAKQTMEYRLGRKPTSSEMQILTGFMSDADRQAWQQNVYAPSLGNWEKGARAYETEEDQGSETYEQYDSNARFTEYFENRYENELDHRDRVDQVSRNSPALFASIDKISRSI